MSKDGLESATEERKQEIEDARMEYGHLMSNYMSLVNMFWIGYGAFFTINSLLATMLGLSYSRDIATFNSKFLLLIHILIPATGIFISACAAYASIKIVEMQKRINERGRALEDTLLHAHIFQGLRSYSERSPIATILGSGFFALMWAATFFAISK